MSIIKPPRKGIVNSELKSHGYKVVADYYFSKITGAPGEGRPTEHQFLGLGGKIEFDLGKLIDPKLGPVRIRGEFARLRPRYKRDNLSSEEFNYLAHKLTTWVDLFFDRSTNPEYWTIIDSVVLFAAFGNPFHRISSVPMELTLKTYFWLWHHDDVLELAASHSLPFDTLQSMTDQFLRVLRGETREYVPVESCPEVHRLFNAILNIYDAWTAFDPAFSIHSQTFMHYLQRYFDANLWATNDVVSQSHSEETFVHWRRIVIFADGLAEVIHMLEMGSLPENMIKNPLFRRILDIANSVTAFANDLLGLRKELLHKQTDNFVVFKVVDKGIPLGRAVDEVCTFLTEELQDYVLLRDTLLAHFKYDDSLIQYIDVLEAFLDGHIKMYNHSARHFSVGAVKMT